VPKESSDKTFLELYFALSSPFRMTHGIEKEKNSGKRGFQFSMAIWSTLEYTGRLGRVS